MDHLFPYPKMGFSWLEILHDPLTRKLLGFDAVHAEKIPLLSGITTRLTFLLHDATKHLYFLKIGYTALEAFLQANVTGPPLDFNPEDSIFPPSYKDDIPAIKKEMLDYLTVDGSPPYSLTPHIELFFLAKVLLSNATLAEVGFNGRRGRFRVSFWHQKLLSEESASLRDLLYSDAEVLEQQLGSRLAFNSAAGEEHFVEFLVERAVIRTYYGDETLARADLARAATTRQFQFALTGALGKRTKYQDRDISQLVVLAKSRDFEPEPYSSRRSSRKGSGADDLGSRKGSGDDLFGRSLRLSRSKSPGSLSPIITASPTSAPRGLKSPTSPIHSSDHIHQPSSPLAKPPTKPENLLLNDDTLLERISFKPTPVQSSDMTQPAGESSTLPSQLAALDPANQPVLFPMDSVILLATASSISNTSPADGLVREETLPYATRVLDGGSSNWQVYTQALLVRSRIEGYKSRTAERGLLQLQALVDQVIAETSPTRPPAPASETENASAPTSFLPKPSESESASVAERLQYVYQLSPPLRWELEAELAQRWTAMGGLKTALEIYERLEMHAEVALCLAATDREAEAVKILREMLFETAQESEASDPDSEKAEETMKLKSPAPPDTARLLCILGDITNTPSYYTLAWTSSRNRYSRAQRSLGRYYMRKRDAVAAATAYELAVSISRLDRSSWFALGCAQLALEQWESAVETFTRCVQLDERDAEGWSNLAVALLRLPVPEGGGDMVEHQIDASASVPDKDAHVDADADNDIYAPTSTKYDRYAHTREALRALRRAATLKRDDPRIWDNYLTAAASIPPSADTPWGEVVQAMGRVVELRGKREGEGCIDVGILGVVVRHITETYEYPRSSGDGGASTVEDAQDAGADADTASGNPLPYLARSFLSLVDTQITPLATSSSALFALLGRVARWRARPAQALSYAETSWRQQLTSASASEEFDDVPEEAWREVVDKTLWLVEQYRELGPRERERTGGQVEAKWRFKARSAGRRVLGRAKGREGTESYERLREGVEGLKE